MKCPFFIFLGCPFHRDRHAFRKGIICKIYQFRIFQILIHNRSVVRKLFVHLIAKCFANYYELRAGFLDGATKYNGEEGYVKFSGAMIPTLVFGQMFRIFLEINSSASIGNLRQDFMVDIIPKFELTFGGTHVRIDFDVGVMQEKNNDRKTIALYVMTAL